MGFQTLAKQRPWRKMAFCKCVLATSSSVVHEGI
jgi:hypothetical protein